jgi:hypothetical protein
MSPALVLFQGLLPPQDVVVVLGEAVGFVADGLDEAEAGVVAREADGLGLLLDVDELFLLREEITMGGFILSWVKASSAAWSWPRPPSMRMTSG